MRKLKWCKLLILMIMFIGIYVMYYMATVAGNTKGSDFFHYHVLPGDVQLHNPKIIYIWTTFFRDYQHWKWGIGPTPVISDCNDAEIDKKCLITTHEKMLEKADVILFALEDLTQVMYKKCTQTFLFRLY